MGKLLIKDKAVVVPGEELAIGMDYLPGINSFRKDDKIISTKLGLVKVDKRLIKVIPLTGRYLPKVNDTLIGRVKEIGFYGWSVDIGSANLANLSIREATEFIDRGEDLTKFYDYNDLIIAKVTKVVRNKVIDLSMKGPGLRKIQGGKIIEVTPSKVPRIIGRQGSMINLVKEKTDCSISVGQNGKVWIKGDSVEKELLATKAILMVEQESHTGGLTDKIKNFLEKDGK